MPESRDNSGAAVWLAVVVGLVLLTIILAYAVFTRLTDETQGDLRIEPPPAPNIPVPPKISSNLSDG